MGPAARLEPEMAWCATRRRATVWGGHLDHLVNSQFAFLVDTWEWDGDLWVQVDDTGPSARLSPAFCADATGGILLFGGLFEPGGDPKAIRWFADTWRWDGTAWTQLADMGPTPRLYAQMALDAVTGQVVLHGGNADGSSKLTDTWAWDGASWTQLADSGPGSNSNSFMAWHAPAKRLTVYAPSDGMWEWDRDAAQWRKVQDIVPPPGVQGCSIPTGVLAFGGVMLPPKPPLYDLADTWTWDGSLWRRVQDFGPSPRVQPAMCWDPDRERVVLYGGSGTNANGSIIGLGDTWELALPRT